MKLTAFEPHWVGLTNWRAPESFWLGVSFLCPHCTHGPCPTCGHHRGKRIALSFWPPIDPEAVMGRIFDRLPEEYYKRGAPVRVCGETFDTLTLETPPEEIGRWIKVQDHWSGVIRDGEIIDAPPGS